MLPVDRVSSLSVCLSTARNTLFNRLLILRVRRWQHSCTGCLVGEFGSERVTRYRGYSCRELQFWPLMQVLGFCRDFYLKCFLECSGCLCSAGVSLAAFILRGARCSAYIPGFSWLQKESEGTLNVTARCKKKLNYHRNYSVNLINDWSERKPWISLAVVSSQVLSPPRLEMKGQQSHLFHAS